VPADYELSKDEQRRYSRHALLEGFGLESQQRLKRARMLVVGVGGLGSPAALYLCAAGVGTLGLVDFDEVDETNLQRQVLFGTEDVGRSKLIVAAGRLRGQNPHVNVELHEEPFGVGNARHLVEAYDLVIDGTDNFATRYLVNDACVMARRPNVYGSVSQFEGQAAVFAAPGGPCYRCLHPEPPPEGLIPNCAEAGVLGVLPGIIGTIQATEAIKLVAGIGEPLIGRLLVYDALRMTFRRLTLTRDPECPVCGDSPAIKNLQRYEWSCEPMGHTSEMTVDQLREWRAQGRNHLLVDVREPSEHAVARIDGSVLIPLGSLSARLNDLPSGVPVVVHCQSGGRSARAVQMLRARGYEAYNLVGGIRAWLRT
jgi:adenylyltransferase/sulfurtransferase